MYWILNNFIDFGKQCAQFYDLLYIYIEPYRILYWVLYNYIEFDIKFYRVLCKYITNHRIDNILCRHLWNCLEFSTFCDWILWICTGISIQLETPKIINNKPSGYSHISLTWLAYFRLHGKLQYSVWHCHERSERWMEGDGEGVGMWCRAQILS